MLDSNVKIIYYIIQPINQIVNKYISEFLLKIFNEGNFIKTVRGFLYGKRSRKREKTRFF